MDGTIVSTDEQYYRTWFSGSLNTIYPMCPLIYYIRLVKGLADGEVQVIKWMAMQTQGPV